MEYVLIELWRPITFYLIVSIHHTVRLIVLDKNNYVAKSGNNLFKSYGPPKFYKDMSHMTHIYVLYIYIQVILKFFYNFF